MLRKLGDRLGLLELSPEAQPPSVPSKIQTRTITLSELIMTIQVMEVRSLAELPAELSISFEEIFKAAGIPTPNSGWTVERLEEILNSDRIRGLNRSDVQREVLSMLAAENVDAADVVKDAVSRDQALDAFADSALKKRQRWLAEKKQEVQLLEQQIADEETKWHEWRHKKRQREQDMARAVGYLIDKPVISIDEAE
jgi:hypothetical protein